MDKVLTLQIVLDKFDILSLNHVIYKNGTK
jgi:hypothetical protein